MNQSSVFLPDKTGTQFSVKANDVVRISGANGSTGATSTATVTEGKATVLTRIVSQIVQGHQTTGGGHTEYEIKPVDGALGPIVVTVSSTHIGQAIPEVTLYRFLVA